MGGADQGKGQRSAQLEAQAKLSALLGAKELDVCVCDMLSSP